MKIGIFGDSSADPNKNFNYSWVELLGANPNYTVTTYAKQGSNFLYTLNQLQSFYKDFDKVIVTVTIPGRMWVPHCKTQQFFVNPMTVDLFWDKAGQKDKRIMQSVKDYYYNLWIWENEFLVHQSLVEKAMRDFPNALYIPVNTDSIENFVGPTLNDIGQIDYQYYNVDITTPDFGRTCHMNKQNNFIFCQMITEWIETNSFDLDISKFKYPVESIEELFLDI
jgi:hypothetical protein